MKLTFLGSGSAFTLSKENYHSNILIEDELTNMNCLYDVGTTIPDALYDAGLTALDIQSIFISHNHADHSGGMEYMGFRTYFTEPIGVYKSKLYGHHTILNDLWNHSLKAGMCSLLGSSATLESYFEPVYLHSGDIFDIGNIKVRPIRTLHIELHKKFIPSYGLMLTDTNTQFNVFITGDMRFDSVVMSGEYKHADIIFHDCELKEYPNSVHSQYHELCRLEPEIKAKMWLYHYTTDNGAIELPNAQEDGFKGFVRRGDVFEF